MKQKKYDDVGTCIICGGENTVKGTDFIDYTMMEAQTKCKTEGCNNTFIKTGKRHSYCKDCVYKRTLARQKRSYWKNKELIDNSVEKEEHSIQFNGEERAIKLVPSFNGGCTGCIFNGNLGQWLNCALEKYSSYTGRCAGSNIFKFK